MWDLLLGIPVAILLAYLALTTFYLVILAVAYYVGRKREAGNAEPFRRFAVLIPAHNEELLVQNTCNSLLGVDYPKQEFEIFVIADNCDDATAEICRQLPLRVLERHDPNRRGKGQALDWALRQIELDKFDAVFVVDADSLVDAKILRELSAHLNLGEQAIQCYKTVGNRDDSGFTQLIYVSRVIGNELCQEAKYNLGLSSYLMGNGMCFRADLLQEKGWTAFSETEDWEYYAQLVDDGIKVGFAAQTRIYLQESKSLNQATTQRLRWSRGRFSIAKKLGFRLLRKGIRERSWWIIDASFPLLLPNYSLLVNLSLLGIVLSACMPSPSCRMVFFAAFSALLLMQGVLFCVGCVRAGSFWRTVRAASYVPVFLAWKSVIDLLSFTGLYRNKTWVRTKRHEP